MRLSKVLPLLLGIIWMSLASLSAIEESPVDAQEQRDLEMYRKFKIFAKNFPEAENIDRVYFNLAELSRRIFTTNPDTVAFFYRKVLESNPNYPERDVVLYFMAYYDGEALSNQVYRQQEDYTAQMQRRGRFDGRYPEDMRFNEQRFEPVIAAYKRIHDNYPKSTYYARATWRLGELYLRMAYDNVDKQDVRDRYYGEAQKYFTELNTSDDPEMRAYGMYSAGLKSIGNLEWDQAIQDFAGTLTYIRQDSTNRLAASLESGTLDNLVRAIAGKDLDVGADSPSRITAFARENFEDMVTDEHGKEILRRLYIEKLDARMLLHGIDILESYTELYPMDVQTPTLIDSIIYNYQNRSGWQVGLTEDQARQGIFHQMERLVQNYSVDSEWYEMHKDEDIQHQMSIVNNAFETLEGKQYVDAANNPTEDNIQSYIELSDRYKQLAESLSLPSIQDSIMYRTTDLYYRKASQTNAPYDLIRSRNAFYRYNDTYPEDTENYYEFELRAFGASEDVYLRLKPIVQDSVWVDPEHELSYNKDQLDSLYIDASLRFETVFTRPEYQDLYAEENIIQLYTNRGEIYYERGELDKAYEIYTMLLENYDITDAARKNAYMRIAEISFEREDFQNAEKYYALAEELASGEEQEAFRENRLNMLENKSLTLQEQQDYGTAASEFLKLYESVKDTDKPRAIGAMKNAIKSYRAMGDYDRAIELWKRLGNEVVNDNKDQVLEAYNNAYSIADSLEQWDRSISIRRELIDKYPRSNEAFQLELEIITKFYEQNPATKNLELAAQRYLDLFNNRANMDMGDFEPQQLLGQAHRIYRELGMEDKEIEIIHLYDENYPNDPLTESFFLTREYEIYTERGDEENRERVAAYIMEKNPESTFYEDIVRKRVQENIVKAQDTFAAKDMENLEPTREAIALLRQEYQEIVDKYADDPKLSGIPFQEGFNQTYDKYDQFFDYFERFKTQVAETEAYLEQSPQDLMPVGTRTTINTGAERRRMDGAGGLSDRLINKSVETAAALLQLMFEGTGDPNLIQGLSYKDRTYVYYLSGRVIEYSADVIETQFERFLDRSNQIKEAITAYGEEQIAQLVQNDLVPWKNNQKNRAYREAAFFYTEMVTNFYDRQNYIDEWVEYGINRLIEWGMRKPIDTEIFITDGSWRRSAMPLTSNQFSRYTGSTYWQQAQVVMPSVEVGKFTNARFIEIDTSDAVDLVRDVEAEIMPEQFYIDYIFPSQLEIWVNDQKIEEQTTLAPVVYEGENYMHFIAPAMLMMVEGQNRVVVRIPEGSEGQKFMAEIRIGYDQEALEYKRTTEVLTLVSNKDWLTTTNAIDPASQVSIDSTWVQPSMAALGFSTADVEGMNESQAEPVWYPISVEIVDSVEVVENPTSAWFYREFEIPSDVELLNASFQVIGEGTMGIWLNGQELITNYQFMNDSSTGLLMPLPFEDVQGFFTAGKNTIIVKMEAEGEARGFFFDMNYTIKKPNQQ